ncbi:Aureobasidin resistance protein Aur1 [Mortierella polycephala]|uniref:Aureobasidin resistance protein Aur1 n=1 Tax=Mortierella polycephala TaxID=41804 RepID=A0A9P6U4Q0_9FUNG|nr:Aureobasidin resistance protein Aur1 [Mortierella polycephala]
MITITPPNLRYRRGPLLALKTAVATTLHPLQQHSYTSYDLQYLFLFVIFSACYCLNDQPALVKIPLLVISIALLIPKQTRSFMLPFFAVAAWLLLFYSCRFIPSEWRPHIFTTVLPTLEAILYGGNLSNLLASSTAPWKDLLAWLPYGVFHFLMPVILAALVFIFAPSGTLPVFARTFGYMNIAGVLTQLLFPCSPPWYEAHYGEFHPATYSMPGDPGGLSRVDEILGTAMYKNTFTASPLVFGAFPSLHSGCAWQLAFFTVFAFGPRSIPIALLYVFWIWWAAMYLNHHYVVDLVGGGVYAVIAFWIGSAFLPSALGDESSLDAVDLFRRDEKVSTSMSSSSTEAHPLVGMNGSWDRDPAPDRHSDSDEAEDSIQVIVTVDVGIQTESSAMTDFSSLDGSRTTVRDQPRWNGWRGHKSWLVVLSSVRSGRSLSRKSSTFTSTLSAGVTMGAHDTQPNDRDLVAETH